MSEPVRSPQPNAGGPTVRCEVDAGVMLLTLNRPDRLNAWTAEMETSYFDLIDRADDDPDVRVVVLTGAGRGFCPGADLAAVTERSRGGAPRERTRPLTHALSLRKPLVAAINGGCAGLGLLQALVCDVRFAAAEAKLSTSFARLGIPAEFGVSWLLQRLLGPGRAADLLLSGRVVRGSEAHAIGLVEHLDPTPQATLAAALAYAHELAEHCSPYAMSSIKQQLAADLGRDLAASNADAVRRMALDQTRPSFAEGVAAHAQRRLPAFEGLPPRQPRVPGPGGLR